MISILSSATVLLVVEVETESHRHLQVAVAETLLHQAVVESGELIVEISGQTCTDTMKGDSFPNSVTLVVNGRTLTGCGMYLDHPWQ